MDYLGGRHDRILSLYNSLIEGGRINVMEASEYYGVSTKTVKRDIEDIRIFLSEKSSMTGDIKDVVYDRSGRCYRLVGADKLTAKEIFAICKVLLESRAFTKSEFMPIIEKLIDRCAYDAELHHIRDMVANEKFHYCEPHHKKPLIDTLWTISNAIKEQRRIKIKYERLTEPRFKERVVEPVGILFSDYYFYLAAFIPEKHTVNPTIYRIDRLTGFSVLDEKFSVPYSNRFEEGEFRKRVQFMYGGELMKIEFNYFGESPEAVLDRLPTAEILSHDDEKFTFRAEVFGRGIKPWIFAQADKVEVIKPLDLREEMVEMLEGMREMYLKK